MGLFIHAEHCRVRRRVQIQANDVSRLLLTIRIVRGHVALDPMRLPTVLAPHARHHHVADLQLRGKLTRGPMSRAARRVARRFQNPRFQLRGEHGSHPANMPAIESRKSLTPAGHKAAATIDALGSFIPRVAFGQQQNQSCLSGIFRPIRPAVGSPCQFHTFRVRQDDGVCHALHYSL